MTFTHFAKRYVSSVYDVEQDAAPQSKPNGLWLSVDGEDDWPSWCRSEDFRVDKLTRGTRVALVPNPNVLFIRNEDALRAFTNRWAKNLPGLDLRGNLFIDWRGVAEIVDGIVIAPYVYSCRLAMDTTWYYGWDCASGCIWKARAVASIEEI